MSAKVCHFSSVHSIIDTRVFYRECASLASKFNVTLIAIGNFTGNKNGVNIIGIKKPKSRIHRVFFTIPKVCYFALKQNAAIYHIHDAELIPFALILKILGKKVIYDIHENTKQDILLKPWIPKNKKFFIAGLYDLLLQFSSYFLYFIPVIAHKRYLPIFYSKKGKYTVIQNFADEKQMNQYLVPDRYELAGNHIFYVGMIKDMYYDINKLIDALAILKNQGQTYYLHCVGYFGSRTDSNLESNPNFGLIKNQVHFYGYLDMDTAYRISMQCKIGICLKNQPEEMLVSHERKLFEYIAIGLPSIFCDGLIYQEVLEKYQVGISVNLTNPDEIAKAIHVLFTDKIVYNNCVKACEYALSQEYNWESQSEKLIELYEQLLVN